MPAYSQEEARKAVAASLSYAETLRRLGLRAAGGNAKVLRRWLEQWDVSTEHFDRHSGLRARWADRIPLDQVLVEGSTYARVTLKRRLYSSGLKAPVCELCGQDEMWRGRPMSLILDHVNGVADDNRLENLRIVCPNCAATLDTHCGRKNRRRATRQPCRRCGAEFVPKDGRQQYCSRYCGTRWERTKGVAKPERRRVERPPYEALVKEIAATSVVAVARRYGVSDTAIRKWLRQFERERAAAEGRRAA